jgi:hypothetical protein
VSRAHSLGFRNEELNQRLRIRQAVRVVVTAGLGEDFEFAAVLPDCNVDW